MAMHLKKIQINEALLLIEVHCSAQVSSLEAVQGKLGTNQKFSSNRTWSKTVTDKRQTSCWLRQAWLRGLNVGWPDKQIQLARGKVIFGQLKLHSLEVQNVPY